MQTFNAMSEPACEGGVHVEATDRVPRASPARDDTIRWCRHARLLRRPRRMSPNFVTLRRITQYDDAINL
jgi:hypothetical protein